MPYTEDTLVQQPPVENRSSGMACSRSVRKPHVRSLPNEEKEQWFTLTFPRPEKDGGHQTGTKSKSLYMQGKHDPYPIS